MKTIIVYYSLTGNNAALAEKVAFELGAESFRLVERKEGRTTKDIIVDMILERRPELRALPPNLESYDLVVFMGPIWTFHIPSPLKTCFRGLKSKLRKYAFVSLSGGALGSNTKIASELVRRLGKGMALQLDLNIAHYCETSIDPTTKETGAYLVKDHPGDLERLGHIAVEALRGIRVGMAPPCAPRSQPGEN